MTKSALAELIWSVRFTIDQLNELSADLAHEEQSRSEAASLPAETIYNIRAPDGTRTWWIGRELSDRMIHGVASSPVVDGKQQTMSPMGCRVRTLPLPLCSQHRNQIGEIFFVRTSPDGVFVRARIFGGEAGDAAWDDVCSGRKRALSVGFREDLRNSFKERTEEHRRYEYWTLREVSICEFGLNPQCGLLILARHQFARPPLIKPPYAAWVPQTAEEHAGFVP